MCLASSNSGNILSDSGGNATSLKEGRVHCHTVFKKLKNFYKKLYIYKVILRYDAKVTAGLIFAA